MQALINRAVSNANQPRNSVRLQPELVRRLPDLVGTRDNSNCWGTTVYALGGQSELKFRSREDTKAWLRTACERVRGKGQPRFGDVLAIHADAKGASKFRTHGGDLLPTDIFVGRGLYFHQQGYGGEFKLSPLRDILKVYPGRVTRWRVRE